MKWLSVDSPLQYGSLYRSECGRFAIHHYTSDKQALGFGHTNIAQLYKIGDNGREYLVAERCGRDALEQAQSAAK